MQQFAVMLKLQYYSFFVYALTHVSILRIFIHRLLFMFLFPPDSI